MDIKTVKVEKPEATNFILGQAHFIKTVEDIHEAIVGTVPHMRSVWRFASPRARPRAPVGQRRRLIELATRNALARRRPRFIIFMENGFPVNVLNAIKAVPEVCRIFCATANPVDVVVAQTGRARHPGRRRRRRQGRRGRAGHPGQERVSEKDRVHASDGAASLLTWPSSAGGRPASPPPSAVPSSGRGSELIEKSPQLGGACVATGTLPGKVYSISTGMFEAMKKAKLFGIRVEGSLALDFNDIQASRDPGHPLRCGRPSSSHLRSHRVQVIQGGGSRSRKPRS